MTMEEKQAWLRTASNEELLSQLDSIPTDFEGIIRYAKRWGTTFDEVVKDRRLTRAEILRRMAR